jgi:hypothetical protein
MPYVMPGMDLLKGAIDCHVHCAPHLNGRSVNVFEAVRQAAAAGMKAIGIMCNFQNSSGFAALANDELGHLGCHAFGGVIMQPTAGGVTLEVAKAAIGYGYGPGHGCALRLPADAPHPLHRRGEGRSPTFLETTFQLPESGQVPDVVRAIMDCCAERTWSSIAATSRGGRPWRLPRSAAPRRHPHPDTWLALRIDQIQAITRWAAMSSFHFFILTHATQVGLTHVDEEKHRSSAASTIQDFAPASAPPASAASVLRRRGLPAAAARRVLRDTCCWCSPRASRRARSRRMTRQPARPVRPGLRELHDRHPRILAEVTAAFERYEQGVVTIDVAVLDELSGTTRAHPLRRCARIARP